MNVPKDRQDPKGTKERILAAALDEFAEHGLAGARVDRIARRAVINKAMIYYHFDSKEALYDEILMTHLEAAVSKMSDEIDERRGLEDVLRTIASYHHRALTSDERIARIMLRELAAGGEAIRRILSRVAGKEELRRHIVRMIEEGGQRGLYRQVDIRQAMISFAGMSLFYLIIAPMANQMWGIEDDTEFRRQRPGAIVDLFLRGLEAR
jgi:AcrR family transcriptional regulator